MKIAPTILIIGFWIAMMKGMAGGGMGGMGGGGGMSKMMGIGKSNAKIAKKDDVKVTFKDVAGVDEAKREIMEFVSFLKVRAIERKSERRTHLKCSCVCVGAIMEIVLFLKLGLTHIVY